MNHAATALIADDEPMLRMHLRELLGEYWPELEIVAMASNGLQALQLAREHRPQVLFFDIRMPGMTGLEVAAQLQREQTLPDAKLVFLTAYDQYAIEAFDRQALDYLLKPVDEIRLQHSIDRIQQALHRPSVVPLPAAVDWQQLQHLLSQSRANTYLQWINAAKGDRVFILPVAEVVYFRAEDKYTTVVTQDGEYLIRRSLKQLEQELHPDHFWRIHRHTIVQASLVQSVRKDFLGHSWLTLANCATELPVSRRLLERFKQM